MTNDEWAAIEQPYRLAIKVRMGQLLTTTEAAKRRNMDPKYILRLVQTGKIPAQKIGGRWLIEEHNLAALPPKSKRGRPRK